MPEQRARAFCVATVSATALRSGDMLTISCWACAFAAECRGVPHVSICKLRISSMFKASALCHRAVVTPGSTRTAGYPFVVTRYHLLSKQLLWACDIESGSHYRVSLNAYCVPIVNPIELPVPCHVEEPI